MAVHGQAPERVRLAAIQSAERLKEEKLAASKCDPTEAHTQRPDTLARTHACMHACTYAHAQSTKRCTATGHVQYWIVE